MKIKNRYYGFTLAMLLTTWSTIAQEVPSVSVAEQSNDQTVVQEQAKPEDSSWTTLFSRAWERLQPKASQAQSYVSEQGQQLYGKARKAAEEEAKKFSELAKSKAEEFISQNLGTKEDVIKKWLTDIENNFSAVQAQKEEFINQINKGQILGAATATVDLRDNLEKLLSEKFIRDLLMIRDKMTDAIDIAKLENALTRAVENKQIDSKGNSYIQSILNKLKEDIVKKLEVFN